MAKAPKVSEDSPLRAVRLEARALVEGGLTPEDAVRRLSSKFYRAYYGAGGNDACKGQPDKWAKDRRVLIALRVPDLYVVGAQALSLEDALELEDLAAPVADQVAGDTADDPEA